MSVETASQESHVDLGQTDGLAHQKSLEAKSYLTRYLDFCKGWGVPICSPSDSHLMGPGPDPALVLVSIEG